MDYFYDPINIDLNELWITVLAAPLFNKALISFQHESVDQRAECL